jgi:hypothetical protein
MGVAARLLAVAVVAAVGFAQFSTSWHEVTVQHVVCAEHGELTHVSSIASRGPVRALGRAAIQAADLELADAHEHCGFVFAPASSPPSSIVRVAARFEPPPVVAETRGAPAPHPGRAFVLASAPKTSPPIA